MRLGKATVFMINSFFTASASTKISKSRQEAKNVSHSIYAWHHQRCPTSLKNHSISNLNKVTFDRTLSFSKHVSSLKAKFFPRPKALCCISASSWGPYKESLSLLYKSFLRSLLTYASPRWFPFLSATNFTKLERLH